MRRELLAAAATILAVSLLTCGCTFTSREQAATDDAVIGFFAGGAVGCTAAAISGASADAFGVGCPIGMALGTAIGWVYGFSNYPSAAAQAPMSGPPRAAPPS